MIMGCVEAGSGGVGNAGSGSRVVGGEVDDGVGSV